MSSSMLNWLQQKNAIIYILASKWTSAHFFSATLSN